MGTYYEIRCRTCDVDGGVYADRLPHLAEEVLACAHAFAAMALALSARQSARPLAPQPGVKMGGAYIDLHFFLEHHDHDLHVVDGYGVLLGQCREWMPHEKQTCARLADHEGPCSTEGPFKTVKKTS